MGFTAKIQRTIHAPLAKVWDALTKPELVKQYFFGTNLITTWQVGQPVWFEGGMGRPALSGQGHGTEICRPKSADLRLFQFLFRTRRPPGKLPNHHLRSRATRGKHTGHHYSGKLAYPGEQGTFRAKLGNADGGNGKNAGKIKYLTNRPFAFQKSPRHLRPNRVPFRI